MGVGGGLCGWMAVRRGVWWFCSGVWRFVGWLAVRGGGWRFVGVCGGSWG